MDQKIMFLMPEFPGHTHTWLWREICGLRANGLDVSLASTRRPQPHDHAKHSFANEVEGKVFYAWPPDGADIITFLMGVLLRRPQVLSHCLAYLRAIRGDDGPPLRKTVPLIIAAWRLARECRANTIQHIHVATPANSIIVAQLACIMHPMTCDVTVNANLGWWGGGLNTKFGRSERIYVVAQWMKDEVDRDFPPAISDKTLVARHGVDTEAWMPASDRERRQRAPFHIVSVGRLHPAKGHGDLIRAVHQLVEEGRDIHLCIAGGGPARVELDELIASLGIGSSVHLLGPRDEEGVKDMMRNADLFVGASHAEALGVVYMEAMSCGLPVVGTNVGGVPEIVRPGVNGLLVPSKDPDALAGAIRQLVKQPALREELARTAREHVVENFDSSIGAGIVAEEIKKILKEVAS